MDEKIGAHYERLRKAWRGTLRTAPPFRPTGDPPDWVKYETAARLCGFYDWLASQETGG